MQPTINPPEWESQRQHFIYKLEAETGYRGWKVEFRKEFVDLTIYVERGDFKQKSASLDLSSVDPIEARLERAYTYILSVWFMRWHQTTYEYLLRQVLEDKSFLEPRREHLRTRYLRALARAYIMMGPFSAFTIIYGDPFEVPSAFEGLSIGLGTERTGNADGDSIMTKEIQWEAPESWEISLKDPIKVSFFDNGNTMVFQNGEQVEELQEPWIRRYLDGLSWKGIDLTALQITMPNGQPVQVVRNKEGWNLTSVEGAPFSVQESSP